MKIIKEISVKTMIDRGVIYSLFSEKEGNVMRGKKIIHISMKEECMRCGVVCVPDIMVERNIGMICEKCIEEVRT